MQLQLHLIQNYLIVLQPFDQLVIAALSLNEDMETYCTLHKGILVLYADWVWKTFNLVSP